MPFTFHPKLYLFKSPSAAEVLIGSGNLTEGGLYTNYESTVKINLDLSKTDDREVARSIEHELDHWSDTSTGAAKHLDAPLLEKLVAAGLVQSESGPDPDTDQTTTGGPIDSPAVRDLNEPFDYHAHIIRKDSARYPEYLARCSNRVRNSRKTIRLLLTLR